MVVCGGMNDFDIYIGGVRQASLVGWVHEVPAVALSKEAMNGVYYIPDSERLGARRSTGVAALVDIGHVGVGATTR